MTVYVSALGEEITRERAIAYAEERLGRRLTEGERALDLIGLDVDLADGKERLTAAIETERRRALASYLAGGSPALRITAEMEDAMIALVEAGRRHAREEFERLGIGGREFAEPGALARYSLPTLFYRHHVALGRPGGFVLNRDAERTLVEVDERTYDDLLDSALATASMIPRSPSDERLIVSAEEALRILLARPFDDVAAVPPEVPPTPPRHLPSVPGEDELGDAIDRERDRRRRRRARRTATPEEERRERRRDVDLPEPEPRIPPPREPRLPEPRLPVPEPPVGTPEAEKPRTAFGPVRGDDRFGRYLRELSSALTAIRVRLTDEASGSRFARGEISDELLDKLDRRIPGARDFASRVISGLLIGGAGEIYEANSDLFPCFIYSAVMDAATCEVCRSFDGRRYRTWVEGEVDLPGGGPNPRCLGDGRCRCRLVPCAPGETVEDVPEQEHVELTETDLIREEAERFERLRREDLAAMRTLDGPLVARNGYPSGQMLTRERHMREIGKRIDDEVHRRLGPHGAEPYNKTLDRIRAAWERAYKRSNEKYEKLWAEEFERRYPGADPLRIHLSDDQWNSLSDAILAHPDYVKTKKRELRAHEKLQETRREGQRLIEERFDRIRDTYREVLAEVVPMGTDADLVVEPDLDYGLSAGVVGPEIFVSDADAGRRLVQGAGRFYPKGWIDESNRKPLRAWLDAEGRGFYDDNNDRIVISPHKPRTSAEPGSGTALHELGHRMQWIVPEIRAWEWAFHARRTVLSERESDRELKSMADIFPGSGYGEHETTYPDDFATPYIGKRYGDAPWGSGEVLSMAMEALFSGSGPTGTGTLDSLIDPDMRAFVLGLIATVGRGGPWGGETDSADNPFDPRRVPAFRRYR